LWVINQVTACSSDSSGTGKSKPGNTGSDGGGGRGSGGMSGMSGADSGADAGVCAPTEAMYDPTCADSILTGKEFIFDIQTHWFNKADLSKYPAYQNAFGALFDVATEDNYIKDLFCNSDTSMVCLTAWPGVSCTPTRPTGCGLPLSNDH